MFVAGCLLLLAVVSLASYNGISNGRSLGASGEVPVEVNPEMINITTEPGMTEIELTLNNTGNVTIDWEIGTGYRALFSEDFEDGIIDGWNIGSGTYTRKVDSTTAANGSNRSLEMTGGELAHRNGIDVELPSIKPTYIGFHVRPGDTDKADGYFLVLNDRGESVIMFLARHTGFFQVNTDSTSYWYDADTWYHIEFRDIDWDAHVFDYYVNGALRTSNMGMSNALSYEVSELSLYNYHNSTVRYDEILLGDEIIPHKDMISFDPASGILGKGNRTVTTLMMNGSRMEPGIYSIPLMLTLSNGTDMMISIPMNVTLSRPDHDIAVESLDVPVSGKAGTNLTIEVLVNNSGLKNETDLVVRLFVDEIEIGNKSIASLDSGNGVNVTFGWIPPLEGEYAIRIVVDSVPGENNTLDNYVTADVQVSGDPEIFVDPESFNITVKQGEPIVMNVTIGNDGLGTLSYDLSVNSIRIFEDFQGTTLNTNLWGATVGTPEINTDCVNPPSDPYALDLDGDDDTVESVEFDLSTFTLGNISFSYELGGNGEEPDPGDFLSLEYWTSENEWSEIWYVAGESERKTTFETAMVSLPSDAFHDDFKFRFLSEGSGLNTDDFFVDDIYFNCSRPDSDQISFDNATGTVRPQLNSTRQMMLNSTELEPGSYFFGIQVNSNDPLNGSVQIPINVTILQPDHDLEVLMLTIDPVLGVAGENVTVNATILNKGRMNETDQTCRFLVDGKVVDNLTISDLNSGKNTTITLKWMPMNAGTFLLEVYVVPPAGDVITGNNLMNIMLNVTAYPEIAVEPTAINVTIGQGMATMVNITIENSGIGTLDAHIRDNIVEGGSSNIEVGWDEVMDWAMFDGPNKDKGSSLSVDDESRCMVKWDLDPLSGDFMIAKAELRMNYYTVPSTHSILIYRVLDDSWSYSGNSGTELYDWAVAVNEYERYTTPGSTGWVMVDITDLVIAELKDGNDILTLKWHFNSGVGASNYFSSPSSMSLSPHIIVTYNHTFVDHDWLNSTNPLISIGQGNESVIPVSINATMLNPGTYNGNISIASNDLDEEMITIPVNLTVEPVDHEIRIMNLTIPENGEAGKNISIGVRVLNQGLLNETGLEVRLLQNGSMITNESIRRLNTSEEIMVVLNGLLAPGTHEIKVQVIPVPGETITYNNEMNGIVTITAQADLWVDPGSVNITLERGLEREINITIGNSGWKDLTYEIIGIQYEASGEHEGTEGDIDDILEWDNDDDGRPDLIENLSVSIESEDDDSMEVFVSAWNGVTWRNLYSSLNRRNGEVVNESFSGLNYSKLRIELDDTEDNDIISYSYRMTGRSILDWLELSATSGNVTALNESTIVCVLNTTTCDDRVYWMNLTFVSNDPDGDVLFPIRINVTPAEHDIAVSGVEMPALWEAGKSLVVKANVTNAGLQNERNVTVVLKINGILNQSMMIGSVEAGNTTEVTYFWTPPLAGIYKVEVMVMMVASENIFGNNRQNSSIVVTAESDLILGGGGADIIIREGESSMINVTLENGGLADLDWSMRCEGITLFQEDFEDGDLHGWSSGDTRYSKEIVTSTGANGTRSSLLLEGWGPTLSIGLSHDLPETQPTSIGFWVRSGSNIEDDAFIVFGDEDTVDFSTGGFSFFARSNGNLQVNDRSTLSYASGTWYHIEYMNINWLTKRFDCFVNGNLRSANVEFEDNGISEINKIIMYNYQGTPSWYDEIVVLGEFGPDNELIDLSPASNTTSPGEMDRVNISVDSDVMSPDRYRSELLIQTNDPDKAVVIFPFNITIIRDGHDLKLHSMIVPGEGTAGVPYPVNISVVNLGTHNESDVEVRFLVNGSLVDSLTISEIESGKLVSREFLWTSMSGGERELEVEIVQVTGETILGNNMLGRVIGFSAVPVLLLNPVVINRTLTQGWVENIDVIIDNPGYEDLEWSVGTYANGGSGGEKRILVFTQYTDREQEYPRTMEAIDTVTTNYQITELDDYTKLDTKIGDADIFLIPEQEGGDHFTIGGYWSDTLGGFLAGGGCIITCHSSQILDGTDHITLTDTGKSSSGNAFLVDTTHPLSRGISAMFSMESATTHVETHDGTSIAEYSGEAMVIHKEVNSGDIIFIGYDYYDTNSDANTLIGNAVDRYGTELFEWAEWLSMTPANGTVTARNSSAIILTMNATELEVGTYWTNVTITSNDPDRDREVLPVRMVVEPALHEIAVLSVDGPELGVAGTSLMVNGTILNQGLSNETNVTVELYANGELVNNITLPFVPSGSQSSFNISWNPPFGGEYLMELWGVPVVGENVTFNNRRNDTIQVAAYPEIEIMTQYVEFTVNQGDEFTKQDIMINNTGRAELDINYIAISRPQALSFNGIDDIVVVPYHPSMDTPDGISIEVWVRPDRFAPAGLNDMIITKDDLNSREWQLSMDDSGRIRFTFWNDIGHTLYTYTTVGSISVGQWNFIAVTAEADGNMTIFINGIANGSLPFSGGLATGSDRILFGDLGDRNYPFSGAIDEVRIMNYPLTPAEILEDYSAQGYYPQRSGTVAWWHFDRLHDSWSLFDHTLNENDGSISRQSWTDGHGSPINVTWFRNTNWGISIDPLTELYAAIMVDATYLDPGSYIGYIIIRSNDDDERLTIVQVNLTVVPVDHEMKVDSLVCPDTWEAGYPIDVQASIRNQGNMDETSIGVHLLVNGDVVEDRIIGYLEHGNSTSLLFNWTPAIAGEYLIEVRAQPVAGENITYNNFMNSTVSVTADPDIDVVPTGMNITVHQGTIINRNLTIMNNGLADLEYDLIEFRESSALSFDGINDYVRLPDEDGSWLPVKNFVIEVWVNFHDVQSSSKNDIILDLNFCDSSVSARECGITVRRDKSTGYIQFSMTLAGNPDEVLTTTVTIPIQEWHHLAFVRNDTYMAIFIDGEESVSRTCPNTNIDWNGNSEYDDDSVNIGRHLDARNNPGQYFNGIIDEIRILERGLNSEEIRADYLTLGSYIDQDDTVAWWHFDENEGNVLADSSGNGNDGTISGAQWVEGVGHQVFSSESINITSASGTVEPFGMVNSTVTINTTFLTPDVYRANITIVSNDPDEGIVKVPMNLTLLPPIHELALNFISIPPGGEAGEGLITGGTVFNNGIENETNIGIDLIVNGEVVNSTDIPTLNADKEQSVFFIWEPIFAGEYFLEVLVHPVPGENITWNNALNGTTMITAEPDISLPFENISTLIVSGETTELNVTILNLGYADLDFSVSGVNDKDHSDISVLITGAELDINGGVNPEFVQQLDDFGFNVTHEANFPGDVSMYDVIVLVGTYSKSKAVIDEYVAFGGGLVILENVVYHGSFEYSADSNPVNSTSGWFTRTGTDVIDPEHPITSGLDLSSSARGYSTNPELKSGANTIIEWSDGTEFTATYHYGLGNVVYINDLWSWYGSTSPWDGCNADLNDWGPTLMKNSVLWAATQYPNELKTIHVSPANGTVDPLGNETILLTINASSLEPGLYNGTVIIASNDPDERVVMLEVFLTVGPADHDLKVVNITAPTVWDAGFNLTAQGNILNLGRTNETDIKVRLLVDEIEVGNTTIAKLDSENATSINLTWRPMIAGVYDISIMVDPMIGEGVVLNNLKNTTIEITGSPELWIDPDELEVMGRFGEFASFSLRIGNSGSAPLNYSLEPKVIGGFDRFETPVMNWTFWDAISGTPEINDNAISEPTAPYSLNLDGSGDMIQTKEFDLSGTHSGTISYWYQLGGTGESPDSDDSLTLWYFRKYGDWAVLKTIIGTGGSENVFHEVVLDIPEDAFHHQFMLRFNSAGNGEGYDDFFVDDVRIDLVLNGPGIEILSGSNGTLQPYTYLDVMMRTDAELNTTGAAFLNVTLLSSDPDEPRTVIPITLFTLVSGHDVALVAPHIPQYHQVGTDLNITVPIFNQGIYNETDVNVILKVNSQEVSNRSIPSLASGKKQNVSFTLPPMIEGNVSLEIMIAPVQNESLIENNEWNTTIKVRSMPTYWTDMPEINVTLPTDVPIVVNITIGNTGKADLEWTVENGMDAFLIEDFDDGSIDDWIDLGNYAVSTENSGTPDGSGYSVKLTGGSVNQCDGIIREIPLCSPEYVSFNVKPGSETLHDSFTVLGGNDTTSVGNSVIYLYAVSSGEFNVNGNTDVRYSMNTWYHIEFRNVNWSSHTFDYYVNGNLIEVGLAFQRSDLAGLTRVHLYHYSYSTAWWDDIILGMDDRYLPPWITLSDRNGTVSLTNSILAVTLNGSGLNPGIHTTSIYIGTNDPREPTQIIQVRVRRNTPPVAVIRDFYPYEPIVNQTIFFEGDGFDADGWVVEYQWSSSIDGPISTQASFNTSKLSPGDHIITFTVMDNEGEWSDPETTSIYVNIPPDVTLISRPPSPSRIGAELTFSAEAFDLDGSIGSVQWSSTIIGNLSSSKEFTTSSLDQGNHTITFWAVDDRDVLSEEISFNLLIGDIPTALIDLISPTISNQGDAILFRGRADSPNADIVTYRWRSSLVEDDISNDANFSITTLPFGSQNISFEVLNEFGFWSPMVNRTVIVNARPIAVISPMNPEFSPLGWEVTLVGTGNDPDGTIEDYIWTSSLQGRFGTSSSITTSLLLSGDHTISFRVMDDTGTWSLIQTWQLTVSSPPKATIDQISTERKDGRTLLHVTGHGNGEGMIKGWEWRSDKDEIIGSDGNMTFKDLSPGFHTISFRVCDEWGIWSHWVEYQDLVIIAPVESTGSGDEIAIPFALWIILAITALSIAGIMVPRVHGMIKDDIQNPRERLLKLRNEFETAGLQYDRSQFQECMRMLTITRFRSSQGQIKALEAQMNGQLNLFAICNDLLWDVRALSKQADEKGIEYDRTIVERTEDLFKSRQLDDMKWAAAAAANSLRGKIGTDEGWDRRSESTDNDQPGDSTEEAPPGREPISQPPIPPPPPWTRGNDRMQNGTLRSWPPAPPDRFEHSPWARKQEWSGPHKASIEHEEYRAFDIPVDGIPVTEGLTGEFRPGPREIIGKEFPPEGEMIGEEYPPKMEMIEGEHLNSRKQFGEEYPLDGEMIDEEYPEAIEEHEEEKFMDAREGEIIDAMDGPERVDQANKTETGEEAGFSAFESIFESEDIEGPDEEKITDGKPLIDEDRSEEV